MSKSFVEEPILNSPYEEPARHHALDAEGQPTDLPPLSGRSPSALLSPVPKSKKRRSRQSDDEQQKLKLYADDGISSETQEYNPMPIINDIRMELKRWRSISNPQDWGVTPATAQLLKHWRNHQFQGIRPFFCQIEAVETIIWLTEGWDAKTVTHILGIRAFDTQLLCEQVVGRSLRRLNYDLNNEGRFDSEYADILGIPFNFTAKPVAAPPKAPKKTTHIYVIKEREALKISFPRIIGYCVNLPEERLKAEFTEDSSYVIEHEKIGTSQTDMSGIVGEEHTLSLKMAQNLRHSTIVMNLAKEVLNRHFGNKDGEPKIHLFGQIKNICRRWIDEGYLKCPGDTEPWMLSFYPEIAAQATERIITAIGRALNEETQIKAVIDPYTPTGSTWHVNYVVSDSDWETEFARVAENHPKVLSYVKNQGLGFTAPYKRWRRR